MREGMTAPRWVNTAANVARDIHVAGQIVVTAGSMALERILERVIPDRSVPFSPVEPSPFLPTSDMSAGFTMDGAGSDPKISGDAMRWQPELVEDRGGRL